MEFMLFFSSCRNWSLRSKTVEGLSKYLPFLHETILPVILVSSQGWNLQIFEYMQSPNVLRQFHKNFSTHFLKPCHISIVKTSVYKFRRYDMIKSDHVLGGHLCTAITVYNLYTRYKCDLYWEQDLLYFGLILLRHFAALLIHLLNLMLADMRRCIQMQI